MKTRWHSHLSLLTRQNSIITGRNSIKDGSQHRHKIRCAHIQPPPLPSPPLFFIFLVFFATIPWRIGGGLT